MNAYQQRPEDKPKSIGLTLWRLQAHATFPWNQGWGFKREGWCFFHIRLGYVLIVVKIRRTNKAQRRYMDKMRAKRPISLKRSA